MAVKSRIIESVAAVWGFAEATLFFIVPDVWLTCSAVKHPKRALLACLWATAGALVGGMLMYWWGSRDAAAALRVAETLPAINSAMTAKVAQDLHSYGLLSLFAGPLTGVPYKLYAIHAGNQAIPLVLFLMVSVPARILRFLLVTLLVVWARQWPVFRGQHRRLLYTTIAVWMMFYILYFSMVGR